jgi:hypothetical protein
LTKPSINWQDEYNALHEASNQQYKQLLRALEENAELRKDMSDIFGNTFGFQETRRMRIRRIAHKWWQK